MELDPGRYTIAWIAPLEIEARAAASMFDREHVGRFPMERGDDYIYQAGEICGHNVIIASLPAGQEYGTGSAAALASQVKRFFPNFWFGLLVGVAAGLPRLAGPSPRDIRLGDILVALPEGESAGLIAYDLGKESAADGFQLLRGGHVLAVTEPVVRSAIGSIKRRAPDDLSVILPYYDKMKDEEHGGGSFADPGQSADVLYEKDESGSPTIQVTRERRPDQRRTRIWYGSIGSGEKLMKNASKRDELRDRYNLIGLEMEAAGTMNRIPVGVIRGVCDYGDEYKNKEWQPYAAAMAAAYAKAVLAQIGPRRSTTVHCIPFRRNPDFTGRQTQLDQLQWMLFRENRERVAVVGLGGMGKTQIALELAYRVQNREVEGVAERYSVFWVQAQSMAAFHKTAGELVRLLNIAHGDDNPKEALQAYLSSEAAGYWLLVLDNVDDAALLDGEPGQSAGLSDFFPRNPNGRLLLTTRQTSVAVDVAGTNVVELLSMPFAEAYLLMERLLLDKDQVQNTQSTKELLEKLACLPLTVAQAAAYMNRNKAPIVRYLERCRSADQNMIDLLSRRLRDDAHYSDAQGAVATTWTVSFEAIRGTDANAVRILSFIRWIESKAIPVSMLPGAESGTDLDDSIGLLCGYGFLRWREDSETLDMHSLVHLVLRLWLDQEMDQGLTTESMAIEHLNDAFPWSNKWENRQVWQKYLPHVLPLINEAGLRRSMILQSLSHRVGNCLQFDGRIKEMVDVYELLVAVQTETLAETHPVRLQSQLGLATAYQDDGQANEATKILERIATIPKEMLPETDTARLASQHLLACSYLLNDEVGEGIKLLEHVVSLGKETLEEEHPYRLSYGQTAEHALAIAYRKNGQVEEAVMILEHLVAINETTLPESHPWRLASLYELSNAYGDIDQPKEQIRMLEYVVGVWEETLDQPRSDQLVAQNGLVRAYLANHQFKEAVEMLEDVVAKRKEILAVDHPDRLTSQSMLAYAYQRANQRIDYAYAGDAG